MIAQLRAAQGIPGPSTEGVWVAMGEAVGLGEAAPKLKGRQAAKNSSHPAFLKFEKTSLDKCTVISHP
jgi:hypothetical protein